MLRGRAADDDAFDQACVAEVTEALEGWVGMMGSYTEVAANLAHLFTTTAEAAGGWPALAEERWNPAHRDALPRASELHDWLMSAP